MILLNDRAQRWSALTTRSNVSGLRTSSYGSKLRAWGLLSHPCLWLRPPIPLLQGRACHRERSTCPRSHLVCHYLDTTVRMWYPMVWQPPRLPLQVKMGTCLSMAMWSHCQTTSTMGLRSRLGAWPCSGHPTLCNWAHHWLRVPTSRANLLSPPRWWWRTLKWLNTRRETRQTPGGTSRPRVHSFLAASCVLN